ncbi:hypothetical protein [Tenacibaculum dicentrarchi]|uniref:hypothetical protein n=1 Tax=Tenacibaculum dicentrarchi TaxID=669041 RepID=UPI0035125D94
MKKIAIISALIFCGIMYGQGTTKQEYLYMTKGLKIQEESGLDVKKGYKIVLAKKQRGAQYNFVFRFLIRENEIPGNRLAGILVSMSDGKHYSYDRAIPLSPIDGSKNDLYQKYYDSVNSLGSNAKVDYAYVLSEFLTQYITFPSYFSKIINE